MVYGNFQYLESLTNYMIHYFILFILYIHVNKII